MNFNELYQALERLRDKGEIVNAYGGPETDPDDPDGDVLDELAEYIAGQYPGEKPIWLEAFFQVFNWQFQSMHEGVSTYYSNFYGNSDYRLMAETADFLSDNGYTTVAEQYKAGIAHCRRYEYPAEKTETAARIDRWINWNTKPVWDFYVDVLETHKNEML